MLERLCVRNYVLIDELEIDFSSSRFSVITGETGSGKSIILGALGLVLGEKGDKEAVRLGASQTEISALFSFDPATPVADYLALSGIETEDGTVLVRRIIKNNGRNLISIGSMQVTRSELEVFGHYLVDVSSQSAHQSLLHRESQLAVVDEYGRCQLLVKEYQQAFHAYRDALHEKEDLVEKLKMESAERDYLAFCADEIASAALQAGEDDSLKSELDRMAGSEALAEHVSLSESALRGDGGGGAILETQKALESLRRVVLKDTTLTPFLDRLESVSIELDDIGVSLHDYLEKLVFSSEEIDQKSSRMALIQKLKKKYGPSLDDVIRKGEEMQQSLDRMENSEFILKDLDKKVASAEANLAKVSLRLHEERSVAAKKLSTAVTGNLKKLGLQSALFTIEVKTSDPGAKGADEVIFLIAANKGEKAGEVSAVASGGELSRIMLAIKAAAAASDRVDVMLFDEVDAGIGGAVANAVAECLVDLAHSHQVIAITHLAQIAIKGDRHFLVTKAEDNGRTISHIQEIEGDARVKEIARILSGDTSDIAIKHAKSLLEVQ